MDLESGVRRRNVDDMSELFPPQKHDVKPSRKTPVNRKSLKEKQTSNGNEDENDESCCERYFLSYKAIILILFLVFYFLEVYQNPALENKDSALVKVTDKMKSMQSEISKYLVGAEDKEKKPVEATVEKKVEKSSASTVEEKATTPAAEEKATTPAVEENSTTPAAEEKATTPAAEEKEKTIDKFNPDARIELSADFAPTCRKRRDYWVGRHGHSVEEATKLIMEKYSQCVKGN